LVAWKGAPHGVQRLSVLKKINSRQSLMHAFAAELRKCVFLFYCVVLWFALLCFVLFCFVLLCCLFYFVLHVAIAKHISIRLALSGLVNGQKGTASD